MTDKIEIQGKTVKEAVSEGLLKMGARENEVKVTVLEKPKSGLFGFLGGKQAKVLLEKKAPRGRGGRNSGGSEGHSGHGFGVSSHDDKRRGKNTRRNSGTPVKAKQDNRGKRPSPAQAEKPESTTSGSSQPRRGSRGRGGSQVKGPERDSRRPGDNTAIPKKASNETRSQDNRGGRKQRTTPQATRNVSNENRSGRNMNRNRYQYNDGDMVLDKNDPYLDEQRKHFEAAERVRKNEENGNSVEGNEKESTTQNQRPQKARGSSRGRQDNRNSSSTRNDSRGRGRQDSRNSGRGRNGATSQSTNNQPVTTERQAPQVPDEILVQGIKALKYTEALKSVSLEEANVTLEGVATELFKRAGFPCRCDIVDDEYSLVRIVTDDASAGMLIGRHGSTVDAIEHLVERMSCNAVGERVRMNLDINNYRHRREEALVERVADAVQSVLSSGRPYHIEPQDARERRMVHMEALKTEGLRTYTMYGSGGKHVVIAIDDKPKEETNVSEEAAVDSIAAESVVEKIDSTVADSELSDSLDSGNEPDENPAP